MPEFDFYNKSQVFQSTLNPNSEFPKVIPNQLAQSASMRTLPTKARPVTTFEQKKPEMTGREGELLQQNVHSYLDFCHDIVP